jgi:endoglucanase
MNNRKNFAGWVIVAPLSVALTQGCAVGADAESGANVDQSVRESASAVHSHGFYSPPANPDALSQIKSLKKAKRYKDAKLIEELVETPHAVWFTSGSPKEVKKTVKKTMQDAHHELPVLVAYNLPYRDCSQYSAGGAADSDAYKAWIDAFAKGIGNSAAIVILEPDGLGIIPNNTTIYGAEEWCKVWLTDDSGNVVVDADGNKVPRPDANPAERYALMNYALDALAQLAPNASVYLDGTHSAWLGVGEAAYRLVEGGVQKSAGFFVNTSNYQPTDQLTQFGTWVSSCIAAGTVGADWARGHFDWCPSQYNAALDYQVDYSPEYAATVTAGLAGMLGEAVATTPFVIDTSRNGKGPWKPTATYPDAQDWCNPPGRGAGLPPSSCTDNGLIDAYLWIKVPGESDGSCNRGVAGSTVDPEWGNIVDPAAGKWFPEQALELAKLATPAL